MYAIRVDSGQGLLRVEISGKLVTDEALRALSQAFTLAEASDLKAAFCDLRELGRGPAGTMLLAASLAVRFQTGFRIAFVARSEQLPFLARLVRASGIRRGVRSFTVESEGLAWLLAPARAARTPSSTVGRHAQHVLAAAVAAAPPIRELAATSSEARHSAA